MTDDSQPLADVDAAVVPVDIDEVTVRGFDSFSGRIGTWSSSAQGRVKGLQVAAGKGEGWAVSGGRQNWHGPVTLAVGDGPKKGGARNPDRKQHDKYQFMLSVHDPHNTIANQNYSGYL